MAEVKGEPSLLLPPPLFCSLYFFCLYSSTSIYFLSSLRSAVLFTVSIETVPSVPPLYSLVGNSTS